MCVLTYTSLEEAPVQLDPTAKAEAYLSTLSDEEHAGVETAMLKVSGRGRRVVPVPVSADFRPHPESREQARRRRQIERGQLNAANGLKS
jgi:hypothetical protein